MIRSGLLNPALLSLLARVRHTNTLVIADRGFPYWPGLETIDLSLIDDVPTVTQVLAAVLPNFSVGYAFAAEEARHHGSLARLQEVLGSVPLLLEPHRMFKERVPRAIGLIRTGDTAQYSNVILESA